MTTQTQTWLLPGGQYVLQDLTDRENEVLHYVAAGARNREIAAEMNVSVKTVEFHLRNILGKLGVRSRTEAVVRGCQLGLLVLTPAS